MKRTRIGDEDAAAVARSADLILATRPDLRMFGDPRNVSRRGFEDRQFLAVLDLVNGLTRSGWRSAVGLDDDRKRDAS